MNEARAEYQRLRHNILRRVKRIESAGLSKYAPRVDLPDSRGLTDNDIQKYLRRAQKYEESVRISVAKAKREAKLEAERRYKREKRAVKKLDKNIQNYISGIKKWLKRQGKNPSLINSNNYYEWIGYIEYRKAIEASSDKYKFDKYVSDAEEELTDDKRQIDADEVLADYIDYVKEQSQFIEQSKTALNAQKGAYSSDVIANKFSTKNKRR
jgi:hypothetical protein